MLLSVSARNVCCSEFAAGLICSGMMPWAASLADTPAGFGHDVVRVVARELISIPRTTA